LEELHRAIYKIERNAGQTFGASFAEALKVLNPGQIHILTDTSIR
jgi:hypothetical protein